MGGKGSMPEVPDPTAPPKAKQEVSHAFRTAKNRARKRGTRGFRGTDITRGLLSDIGNTAKKTLLGE